MLEVERWRDGEIEMLKNLRREWSQNFIDIVSEREAGQGRLEECI